jgi:aspartate aminotransferase
LLDSAQVAVIPGAVFDGAGHLRLSYAASREDIRRGVERIAEALTTLNA